MKQFTISNITGGSRKNFRSLASLAKFVSKNPIYGGYIIERCASEDRGDIKKILINAESVVRENPKASMDKIVELCLSIHF